MPFIDRLRTDLGTFSMRSRYTNHWAIGPPLSYTAILPLTLTAHSSGDVIMGTGLEENDFKPLSNLVKRIIAVK